MRPNNKNPWVSEEADQSTNPAPGTMSFLFLSTDVLNSDPALFWSPVGSSETTQSKANTPTHTQPVPRSETGCDAFIPSRSRCTAQSQEGLFASPDVDCLKLTDSSLMFSQCVFDLSVNSGNNVRFG